MTMTEAPLQGYRVVGVQENWYQAAPDAPKQPGGSCWHCGTGIAIEVVIQNATTGEKHTIGTTCAERVGMDTTQVKAYNAERFAAERELRRQQRSKEWRDEQARKEAEQVAQHGEHGTETRYASGCICDRCLQAAPHGTWHRFGFGRCRCLDCIGYVLSSDSDWRVFERTVIVDVDTGEVVDARVVSTRYGARWCVKDGAAWLPVNAARRTTLTNKGYTEAEIPFLCESRGRGRDQWWEQDIALGCPVRDRWGEVIHRAV